MQRPLPADLAEGHTLSGQELAELRQLILKRDHWIKFYQDQELRFSRESTTAADYIRELLAAVRLPFTGYLLQKQGSAKGAYADGWVSRPPRVAATPTKTVKGLRIRGWVPESHAPGFKLSCDHRRETGGACGTSARPEFE